MKMLIVDEYVAGYGTKILGGDEKPHRRNSGSLEYVLRIAVFHACKVRLRYRLLHYKMFKIRRGKPYNRKRL